MRRSNGFADYQEFRREILGTGVAPISACLEDMADEMYQSSINDEFDSLWDSAESDKE